MYGHFRCTSCGRFNRVPLDRLSPAQAAPAPSASQPAAGPSAAPKCGACKTPLDVENAPVHVDDATLEQLVQSSPIPVLIDFYANWCGPCRSLAPVLAQLSRRQAGKVLVVKVDTERDQRFASRLGVSGIPALFVYKDGQKVLSATGARPLAALESWLAPVL